ncbi:MAG: sulfatase, partial [Candidatus Sumerlaeota bacterium]|nr:sulfatase [Candidatus Sumerlaeota bacterium]
DTMRADMVHHLGAERMRTPNLDRLARQSVVFENCFAEGLPTLPVRRALFTGMRTFPWRYDVDPAGLWPTLRGWHRIPSDQPTLAEILLDQGYTTALVADTLHMMKMGGNFQRGFTSYEWIRGQESDSWKTGPLSAIDLAKFSKPGINERRARMLIQYLLNVKDRKTEEDYFCAQVFSKASRWLEENIDNQPLFLWVDSFDPHEPWDPPKAYADLYCPNYEGPELINGAEIPLLTPREKERIKALYCGEATFVDKWLGLLLDTIERLGLMDDSLIALTTDHGTELFDHGALHKSGTNMHAFLTRQLWFLYHPKKDLRDFRVKPFVQDHDFFPTMLHLLGCAHGPVDGVNVWPLVTGERESVRDHVITGFQSFAAVRDEEWNCLFNFEQANAKPRLMHLPADPHELTNAAAEHPDVVRRQRQRLEALLGQPLPATLSDKTYPTDGPYHKLIQNFQKAGKIVLP